MTQVSLPNQDAERERLARIMDEDAGMLEMWAVEHDDPPQTRADHARKAADRRRIAALLRAAPPSPTDGPDELFGALWRVLPFPFRHVFGGDEAEAVEGARHMVAQKLEPEYRAELEATWFKAKAPSPVNPSLGEAAPPTESGLPAKADVGREAVYAAGAARGLTRRETIAIHDYSALAAFHNKHALGSKMRPSCLACGKNDYAEAAITHAELPDILVCADCVAKVRALGSGSGIPAKCADCGTALNVGEAKTFTVCDDCWQRHYRLRERAGATERATEPKA